MVRLTEKDRAQMEDQVNVLSREEKYLLQQYTHHGDIIINAYMRRMDDLETYALHIYNPEVDEDVEARAFFCLFLLEIDPNALKYPGHFEDGTLKWDSVSLLRDETFMNYYRNTIYPLIVNKPVAQKMNMCRRMTANVITKLGAILAKRPTFPKIIMTYRGSRDKYLGETEDAKVLGSFHSTSIDYALAQQFGNVTYKFCVYPGCIWMYVEPITIHKNEMEVLLGPGNRYVILPEDVRKEIKKSENLFLILPPKTSDAKNKTMTNKLIAQLRKHRGVGAAAGGGGGAVDGDEGNGGGAAAAGGGGGARTATQEGKNVINTLAKDPEFTKMLENFYSGTGAAAAGGGGGGAVAKERRGGTRKLKRKSRSRRRRRQTRKQRGGVSVATLDPMNRWVVDPIFVRMEELSEEDMEMVAEMLEALKQ